MGWGLTGKGHWRYLGVYENSLHRDRIEGYRGVCTVKTYQMVPKYILK